MLETRIKEALSDESFTKELFALETAEEAQVKLREKGIELSLDEINAIPKTLRKMYDSNGELSEDALEDVAGGVIATGTAAAILIGASIEGGSMLIAAAIKRGW